jgi:phage shock protein A
MLNEIMNVFRRSVAAFRDEIATREPEDQVAELLAAMRKELVAARAAIPEFEADVVRARAELEAEGEALRLCERRGTMARRISDTETARVADEFAAKHRERITVIQQKVSAAEAELQLQRREAEEMKRRYQEADANRFALLAQVRRAAAAERMRSGSSTESGVFSDWSRMEEKVERGASYVDALNELDEQPPAGANPGDDADAIEARLRELKRRLGRDA